MSEWHGYPVESDTFEGRPWWRVTSRTGAGIHGGIEWTRTDGRRVTVTWAFADAWWSMHNGTPVKMDRDENGPHILARIDREHPLPPPAPKVGQVWVEVRGGRVLDEVAVTRVLHRARGGYEVYSGGLKWNEEEWPPPGAVLVTGPGAPWGPTEPEKDPDQG